MQAAEVMRALRVTPRARPGGLESRSGAGVHPVTTADGSAAFLKLGTTLRELRFYRESAVPVRTPALLDHLIRGADVALLLSAEGDTVDVTKWTGTMWAELLTSLAALHATPAPPWGRPGRPARADAGRIRDFWGTQVFPAARELEAALSGVGRAFVHGDCHTENITVTGDGLVFCDWQSAGAGRASQDLALLSVRATPAGVRVPLELYPGDDAFRRAVRADELAILIFQWPLYAGYNTPEGNERIRERGRLLAAGF